VLLVDGPETGAGPTAGPDVGCSSTFLFFFLRLSAGPDSSSVLLPILLFMTLRSAVFASPSGKVLKLKYSPPYSSNLDRQNELGVCAYISKDKTYHSGFTVVTVRMNDFDVRTNSLKITHSGTVSRPQDGCNSTGYGGRFVRNGPPCLLSRAY